MFYNLISHYAVKRMHNDMFTRVCHAPVNLYFDVTPAGRIVTRFSKDLFVLNMLPGVLRDSISSTFNITKHLWIAATVAPTVWPVFPLILFLVAQL